jgi:predicted nucleic acid-binding protein
VRFVDTNVFLYFVSGDPAEAAKQAIACQLLDHEDLSLPVQVLQ